MKHLHYSLIGGASALVLLIVSPSFSQAQVQSNANADNTSMTNVLDTVIITGEKLQRDIRNTASSVSVISSKDLWQAAGTPSVHEVINGIPNVIYTDNVSAPIIRGQDGQGPNNGQNVFWGGTVPRASVNIDGHYANYYETFFGATGIWDVESIEVFKGPQTTSQGANAIAGAVIINTKDPTFKPEAAYQAEVGNYEQRRASLMASGPIYKNELAGRIALDYASRDTFIKYVNPNFLHNGTDQDFDNYNVRGKLLWQPAELPGLETKLTYSRSNNNRPSLEAASKPFNKLEHHSNAMPTWEQTTDTGILDVSYDIDNGIKLFDTVQYSHFNTERVTGTPRNGDADLTQNNFSNESRMTFGSEKDTLSGVTGIFYNHIKSDELLLLSGITSFEDEKSNFGIFGEVAYRLTEQWTLTSGLRYQQDQIQRVGKSALTSKPLDYDETFSAFLPKVSLAYAVTEDWTVGGLVSRGYNPGGVSLNLNSRSWMTFEDESVWDYELFTRASFFDNKLTLNSNIFYMDFKNNQYNIPVVISSGVAQSYTINAEKAHAYGLELGLDYEILYNLLFKTSAGILRTEIDEISGNVAYEGNEFAKSPGYMFSVGLNWDVTDKFSVSGDVRHLDKYYSDVANTPSFSIDGYTISDLKMSYAFNEAMQLYGYVNNVFDEKVATYKQMNRGVGGIEASMYMPRSYGVGIRGSF